MGSKETIVVSAMFSAKPKLGTKGRYFGDTVPDNLGFADVEIPVDGVAKFGEAHFEHDRRNRLDESNPQLLINVGSRKKPSLFNSLTCDTYDGSLADVKGKTIPIKCTLPGE